ncbi:MAG: IclR family transcriptional regulator [Candidatus Limnocylindrales bacterium]
MSNIERALQILDLLSRSPDGARITDLARELDLNRAIPHRLLAELIELGYAAQNPATERYRATFKLGSMGLRQLETAGVFRWAQHELNELASASRELVRLAVVSDSSLSWVAKAQGSESALILDSAAGSDVVLHATASGKAWLSTLPDSEARDILLARGLTPKTARTETQLAPILAELAEARRSGYAHTLEEMEPGVNAIAAAIVPVGSLDGRAVATVSIAGPAARLTADVLHSFAPVLQATAHRLGDQWHVYEFLVAQAGSREGRA